MKKFAVTIAISGKYTPCVTGKDEEEARKNAEDSTWQYKGGGFGFGFGREWQYCLRLDKGKLLRQEGNSYTFLFSVYGEKRIYIEASTEKSAASKAYAYYKRHTTGILEEPVCTILSVRKRDERDMPGRRLIHEALDCLDRWYQQNRIAGETSYGHQLKTDEGYKIDKIEVRNENEIGLKVINMYQPVKYQAGITQADFLYFLYNAQTKEIKKSNPIIGNFEKGEK